MNANAKKWVEALRSGQFNQAAARLKDGHRYCCLGVACEVARANGVTLSGDIEHEKTLVAFPEVMAWLGLVREAGNYIIPGPLYDDYGALAQANDEGKSFAEIADIIESEPKGLFVDGVQA